MNAIGKFGFVPQIEAAEVTRVLRKHSYELPSNVNPKVTLSRWHKGRYCGYGDPDGWVPLNPGGGIATRAFDDHSVRFPAQIDKELRMLLVDTRIEARALWKVNRQ